jgi:hypothetical protein
MFQDNPLSPAGGWYAAAAGAVLGTGLALWWLTGNAVVTGASLGTALPRPAPMVAPSPAAAPPPTARAPLRPAPAAAPPPAATAGPADIRYLGQWVEGGRRAVVLSRDGRNVVVPVPGTVDGRYEVISADSRELVLRDLASSTMQRIALGGAAPRGTAVLPLPPVPGEQTVDYGDEPTAPVVVRPDKLPPPSKRTSDEFEPEN